MLALQTVTLYNISCMHCSTNACIFSSHILISQSMQMLTCVNAGQPDASGAVHALCPGLRPCSHSHRAAPSTCQLVLSHQEEATRRAEATRGRHCETQLPIARLCPAEHGLPHTHLLFFILHLTLRWLCLAAPWAPL